MNIFVRLGILILAIFQIPLLVTSATFSATSLKLQDAQTQSSEIQVEVGDIFGLNIMIDVGDKLVNGASVFLSYDATYLEVQDADEEEELYPFKTGTFLAGGVVLQNEQKESENTGVYHLNYTIGSLFDKVSGNGLLASLSFKVLAPIRSTMISIDYEEARVRKTQYSRVEPVAVEPFDLTLPATVSIRGIPRWDVNQDTVIDIADLVIVGRDFGSKPPINPATDVNEDGMVNIIDLVLIGKHFGEEYLPQGAGAPALKREKKQR